MKYVFGPWVCLGLLHKDRSVGRVYFSVQQSTFDVLALHRPLLEFLHVG